MPDAQVDMMAQADNPGGEPTGVVADSSQTKLVAKWWDLTNDLPERNAGINAANECRKTLLPQWFDCNDPYRGNKPREQKSRRDERIVRSNLIYKIIQQSVAMTVPDDHSFRFDTDILVGESDLNPRIKQTHETLEHLVKAYCSESNFIQYAQEAVFNAHVERLAIIKITFQRDYMHDAVNSNPERRDQQDNIARLSLLKDKFARKKFGPNSCEYAEMINLAAAMQLDSELRIWEGLSFDIIPYACFGWDPTVRSYHNMSNAKWMYQEVYKTAEELLQAYPIRQNEDGITVGVSENEITEINAKRESNPVVYASNNSAIRNDKGPSPNNDANAEAKQIKIREVWSRIDNRVYVMMENGKRFLASYVPRNTCAQWYPFHVLRLNPRVFAVDGISDVELMRDSQDRINRKRTDMEKARYLSIPRGYGSAQDIDKDVVAKMSEHPPGEIRLYNIKTPDGDVTKAIKFNQFQFTPESYDTSKDELELQLMSSIPTNLMGGVGQANYSSEVDVAMQGASINSNARGSIVRRFLEGCYKACAEILCQECSNEEIVEICGPNAFIPTVYDEGQVQQLRVELKKQSTILVRQEIQNAQLTAEMLGEPFTPPDVQAQVARVNQLMTQECMRVFGWPEPMSREAILRRMHCKVTVALNTQADRTARLNGMKEVGATIQMLAQAAASCGMMFDPRPLLKGVVPLFGGDQSVLEMFKPMPQGMMPTADPNASLPPMVAGQNAPQPNKSTQIDTPNADNANVQVDSPPTGLDQS